MSVSIPATLNEITSQPEIWQTTLNRLTTTEISLSNAHSNYRQVIFCGCGSTYYLSQWAASLAETTCGTISRAAPASELFLNPSAWFHKRYKTLLIAVSRSGETSETLRAVKTFQSGGYGDALAITCYPDSSLAQMADHVVAVPDAQENSVAQTRSFTNMMFAITWWLLRPLPSQINQTVKSIGQRLLDNYKNLALQLGEDLSIEHFFFLGNGPLFGLASEAMLKMKEISLSNSEAFHFLEFRHGPKSVVDQNSLVIGLINEETQNYELSVLRDMQNLGARILILSESCSNRMEEITDKIIILENDLPKGWHYPLYLPILQLTAFYRSLAKGLDPDHPANLDPVVLLEEETK